MKAKRTQRVNAGEELFLYWCRAVKLPEPVRNHRFNRLRRFEIDFAWPQWKIGVEIQGGVWMNGRGAHSRPVNILRDMFKHNMLIDDGWRVWHYTPGQVRTGEAIQHLDQIIRAAQDSQRERPPEPAHLTSSPGSPRVGFGG